VDDDSRLEALVRLYGGLYDAPCAQALQAVLDHLPVTSARVRLLNPLSTDDDATARRFALLEID
jgi:hypothetical protein